MPLNTASTINGTSIPMLLDWWQQRKRLANAHGSLNSHLSKGDDPYLQAYYRLMEVYSVVKSGGVKAQTEAVRAFAQREAVLLNQRLADIEAAEELAEREKSRERQKVEQELIELRSANNWRLQTLTAIDPDEEAIVQQHLSAIEKTLMQVQCA
ncbi:MAG: hypothetical protein HC800_06390 [Phormidesmis sp. RL_2_1]|nr:hypothetical protein [Phormidesmis sp. RL_2_1]